MDKQKLEETLKKLIRANGRTQSSVARLLNVAPDTFNKWVRGINRIPDSMIDAFCKQLQLDAKTQVELLQLAGYSPPELAAPAASTPPFKFATKIMPDGKALDPTNVVDVGVTDLYAVFSPMHPLLGTEVAVDAPDPEAYYAFLKLNYVYKQMGWKWFLEGETVMEFEMDVKRYSVVWLNAYRYSGTGIFGGEDRLQRGVYSILVTVSGNPLVTSTLSVR